MYLSRRKLLKSSLGLLSLCFAPHQFWNDAKAAKLSDEQLLANSIDNSTASSFDSSFNKSFVVIQLNGGNDGLNMVVPFNDGRYYSLRPTIGIKPEQVIHLNHEIGFHPAMTGIADLYGQGQVAIFQAVGYPNAKRSHFRSTAIWQTAQPEIIGSTGWLGRILDAAHNHAQTFPASLTAVNADRQLPLSLTGKSSDVKSVSNLQEFAHYNPRVTYPQTRFGENLKLIAQIITNGRGAQIYTISLDGFDTHTQQLDVQGTLLKQLSDGLAAFYTDLAAAKCDNNVLTFVFSEFGRSATENNSGGTDHGTAGPCLAIGGKVRGGIYGALPGLANLHSGHLEYQIDFRDIYAGIIDRWFDLDQAEILGKQFRSIAFLDRSLDRSGDYLRLKS